MARAPERRRPDDREGTASGPDPAAGGGPHATAPSGSRPIWRPESERAGRIGFRRAALIVLGIVLVVWLSLHAFSFWMSTEREVPAPGGAGVPREGSDYSPPSPGTITPGGPAAANPDPQNPMRVNPDTLDGPQRPGNEAGTAPR